MIICPSHLVNPMYDLVNEFINLLPKNISIIKYVNNNIYSYIFGQIIICNDYFIKYNLLKNSETLLKNNNRIMVVDEIDNLMDPLTSEFNLMLELNNIIPVTKKLIFLDKISII
jgi:hypothetical protein